MYNVMTTMARVSARPDKTRSVVIRMGMKGLKKITSR
jgi:hypothetical protein